MMISDRKGISSLEYGVLAIGIVVAVSVGATAFGSTVEVWFQGLATTLSL